MGFHPHWISSPARSATLSPLQDGSDSSVRSHTPRVRMIVRSAAQWQVREFSRADSAGLPIGRVRGGSGPLCWTLAGISRHLRPGRIGVGILGMTSPTEVKVVGTFHVPLAEFPYNFRYRGRHTECACYFCRRRLASVRHMCGGFIAPAATRNRMNRTVERAAP